MQNFCLARWSVVDSNQENHLLDFILCSHTILLTSEQRTVLPFCRLFDTSILCQNRITVNVCSEHKLLDCYPVMPDEATNPAVILLLQSAMECLYVQDFPLLLIPSFAIWKLTFLHSISTPTSTATLWLLAPPIQLQSLTLCTLQMFVFLLMLLVSLVCPQHGIMLAFTHPSTTHSFWFRHTYRGRALVTWPHYAATAASRTNSLCRHCCCKPTAPTANLVTL